MNPATDIPRLSVVLPVYNAARFLGDALNSILGQDFGDFECIAINDGSTDGSAEILNEYGRRDARLRVLDQRNVGLVETLNRGISLSRAPLVARMDADDVCLPGRFTAQMRYFEGRSELGVLGGQVKLIDENGRLLRLVDYPANGKELETFLYAGSPVAHPAVMFRKSAVQEVGLYRKAFRHGEDYDLWLRVHDAGYSIENLKVPLIEYRQHAGNVSVVHRREQALATLAARCAHRSRLAGLPDPTTNLDRLDEQVFELFPSAMMADFEGELFSVRVGINSFETEEQLAQVLLAFERLPASLRCTRSGASFLMQAGRGAWRRQRYSSAATFIFRAIAIAPVKVASIVMQKLTRSLPRRLSETLRQSRERLTSQRASGE